MKITDIKAGRTYRNAGAGTTHRKVLSIVDAPDGVRFITTKGRWMTSEMTLSLKSFASWAGSEVKEGK